MEFELLSILRVIHPVSSENYRLAHIEQFNRALDRYNAFSALGFDFGYGKTGIRIFESDCPDNPFYSLKVSLCHNGSVSSILDEISLSEENTTI